MEDEKEDLKKEIVKTEAKIEQLKADDVYFEKFEDWEKRITELEMKLKGLKMATEEQEKKEKEKFEWW